MTDRRNLWLKRKFSELRSQYKCMNCGSKRVEFAHLKETPLNGNGRGRANRYYDIVRHKDCYTALCSDCHGLFDTGEMKGVLIPSLLELRLYNRR